MTETTATRTDCKGHTWAQVLDYEWSRTNGTRTASISETLTGGEFPYFLAITTGQHESALQGILEGAPVLDSGQFETFDAAAAWAASLVGKPCPRPGCLGGLDRNDRCRTCGTTPPGMPA